MTRLCIFIGGIAAVIITMATIDGGLADGDAQTILTGIIAILLACLGLEWLDVERDRKARREHRR